MKDWSREVEWFTLELTAGKKWSRGLNRDSPAPVFEYLIGSA